MPDALPARDAGLVALRPTVPSAPAATPAEAFLHGTLRPVLKLQNDALLQLVARDVAARVPGFAAFAPPDRDARLRALLRTDGRLRQTLVGVVYGALTADELDVALGHDEVRRRLGLLLTERVAGQGAAVARAVERLHAAPR